MLGLRSIPWKALYSREDGSLLDLVLRPALSCSIQYARSAGYFNAIALAMAADGVEALVGNGGTMRLVAGCLTSPEEAEAIQRGEVEAARLVAEKHRGALEVPTGIVRDALELLAWLVAQGVSRFASRYRDAPMTASSISGTLPPKDRALYRRQR